MFCRGCHYDIRGSEIPRCPECGRDFVPADETTFLAELPTLRSISRTAWAAIRSWAMRNRVWIVLCVALPWILAILNFIPSQPTHGPSPRILSYIHLKAVMTTWLIGRNDRPAWTAFDKQAARREMRGSLSGWTELDMARSRSRLAYRLRALSPAAFATAIVAGSIAILWRRRVRRISIALAILALLMLMPSYNADVVSRMLYPGTHAFLDDYVYVTDVDFDSPNKGTIIAAYDWRTFKGQQRRIIGFADGHVEATDHEQARPLFEAQGIPYPSPNLIPE